MTANEVKAMIGKAGAAVDSDCGIWGAPEYVTPDGWVGVRGPGGRLDEVQASRIFPDPT